MQPVPKRILVSKGGGYIERGEGFAEVESERERYRILGQSQEWEKVAQRIKRRGKVKSTQYLAPEVHASAGGSLSADNYKFATIAPWAVIGHLAVNEHL